MRNKLSKQSFPIGKYLVLYGAGGANLCSAFVKITGEIIIDQTLYWSIVETEDEAIYLSSMLNSPKLTKIISTFQPQGLFGKRHIHTLPLDYIPKYDSEDESMCSLVSVAKQLMEEMSYKVPADLLNPNKGVLASRRRKICSIMTDLASYDSYISICEEILLNSNSTKGSIQ